MIDWLQNITDKDILQENLTFASMYIAVYEHMNDYVVSNIGDFLCDIGIEDGKEFCKETEVYRREIKQRIVDDKGNKDKTKASYLWLIDHCAITNEDYEKFLNVKEVRNKYAHELINVIYYGVTEQEVILFFDMYGLYQKISKWFLINIEASIMGDDLLEDADLESAKTVADFMFDVALNVLYNGKSEEYRTILDNIKENNDSTGEKDNSR